MGNQTSNKIELSQNETKLTNQNVTVTVNKYEDYENLQYSYDKLIWLDYQPASGVTMPNNGSVYFKADNYDVTEHVVSNIDKVAPDKPIITTVIKTVPQGTKYPFSEGTTYVEIILEPNSDFESFDLYLNDNLVDFNTTNESIIQDQDNKNIFYVKENCKLSFIAIDKAGNDSEETKHIDYLDPSSDNPYADYIFISSKFSEKVNGKIQDGVELIYSKTEEETDKKINAFKFVSDADKQKALQNDTVVVVTDSKVYGNPYKGCKEVYSNVALPTVKSTEKSYNFKSTVVAKNTLEITKDTSDTVFNRFANVNVIGEAAKANSFIGGKTTKNFTATNSSSKTSDTQSSKKTYSESATGKFTAKDGATVNSIDGYATVNLDNSYITSIDVNNISESDSSKIVISKTKEQKTLSMSLSDKTTGKVTLKNSQAGVTLNPDDKTIVSTTSVGSPTIVGYTNVTLTHSSKVYGDIINSSYNFSQSDSVTYDLSKSTVTRKYSYSDTFSTSGTLTAKDSQIYGNVVGFATVSLTNVTVEDQAVNFKREEYSTIKETITVKTDKAGIVTETYKYEEKFNRAGKLTAKDSKIGNIENFNNITLTNTIAGNITNNTAEKIVTTGTNTYLSADEYGKPEDYDFQFEEISLYTTPKDSLWGTVTLKDSEVGDITNLKTLTLESSTAKNITNVGKVNFKKGVNTITDFVGSSPTSQLTIAKNTVLILNSIDWNLEANSKASTKVTLNGTLIVNSSNINKDTIFTGKGEIATTNDNFETLKDNVNYLHLINTGKTSVGFSGTANEQADNYVNKAVKWDGEGEYVDWLGYWQGFKEAFDKVDYISFKAQDGDDLTLTLDGKSSDFKWTLQDKKGVVACNYETINGIDVLNDKMERLDLTNGDYILKIEHIDATNKESTSLSYTISLEK